MNKSDNVLMSMAVVFNQIISAENLYCSSSSYTCILVYDGIPNMSNLFSFRVQS